MEYLLNAECVSDDILSEIHGGERIADYITGACVLYGVTSVISLAATGVGLPGAASVGAFCTGWMLGRLLF